MLNPLTLAGIYRDGKVEYSERPAGVGEEVPVVVNSLPASQRDGSQSPDDATRDAAARDSWHG
jgi:hypothetical protein